MDLLEKLSEKWRNISYPFLIHADCNLYFEDVRAQNHVKLESISQGDVVALIGDFNPRSILTLIRLIDLGAILVPLTENTRVQHEYYFDTAYVDVIIDNGQITRRKHGQEHKLINDLRKSNHAGLVLFTSGTTGYPKAILHDLSLFLKRYETPRPPLRTISFLLFDHIGGLNTLFHTLFNKGVVVAPSSRDVNEILQTCDEFNVEVLPTTPTFLRLMLMSGEIPNAVPKSLKIVTYGTEIMDQPTLTELCRLVPDIDFRQTYGMSELGIVRVKSEARNSLFMKIGGECLETRVIGGVLHIRSSNRMLGYLNAASPFDESGWYDTKDIVEEKGSYFKIVGRTTDVINVGGLKFMPSEVEVVALQHHGVSLAQVSGNNNPITGQHAELTVELNNTINFDKKGFVRFLNENLQPHMVPKKINFESINIGHRFKRR